MVAGPAIATYVKNLDKSSLDVKTSVFDKAAERERDRYKAILGMSGKENPYRLHGELAEVMLRDCTIERHNGVLDKVIAKIDELEERWHDVGVTDTSGHANQGAQFVRHLGNMLVLARVIAQGAKNRDESRGAHFKPEFKQRDDKNFLRTTMAMYAAGEGGKSAVSYVRALDYPLLGKTVRVTDEVDISLVKPRARKYETAGAASAGAGGAGSQRTSARPASAS
jgi:succinate dehydrogenase / fumarate reductase flavoprotein subunit